MDQLRGSQRFRVVFLATMGLLATTLVWLAWLVLERDASDRAQSRREANADRAVVALERGLTTVDQRIAAALVEQVEGTSLAAGAVLAELTDEAIRARPRGRLAFFPAVLVPLLPDPLLLEAEQLEVEGRHNEAIERLRRATGSTDSNLAAEALVRVARNLVKTARYDEALGVYEQLRRLDAATVAGLPAALAARTGEIWALERKGDQQAIRRSAQALHDELASARWEMSAAAYEDLSAEAGRRLGNSEPAVDESERDRIALAEAVQWLWRQRGDLQTSGRRTVTGKSGPVLVVWRTSGGRTMTFAATARYIQTEWLASVGDVARLTDASGAPFGSPAGVPDDSRPAIRLLSVTGLPWTIEMFDDAHAPPASASEPRQLLVVVSLIAVFVVFLAGAWFVSRSVAREVETARLQADFVSAVSHEFRTPLTTLCQLTELLARDRVTSDEDRKTYYTFLHRESVRLRRLVEGLLDFGRLQNGSLELRPESIDIAEVVRDTIGAFSAAHTVSSHTIEVAAASAIPHVSVDREAVRLALWNLIDNAVKYSPAGGKVSLCVQHDGREVRIRVRDEGLGIPARDLPRIFDKFARGASARERGIRGTGIGLATAREICRAHGGDITVSSEVGRGSTFSMSLPASTSATDEPPRLAEQPLGRSV